MTNPCEFENFSKISCFSERLTITRVCVNYVWEDDYHKRTIIVLFDNNVSYNNLNFITIFKKTLLYKGSNKFIFYTSDKKCWQLFHNV